MSSPIPPGPKLRALGRVVHHDPRSRAFGVRAAGGAGRPVRLVSVAWPRRGPVFDQGDVGMCTAAALCGVLNTDPFTGLSGWRPKTEEDCVELYKLATRLDRIPGHYLPDDTGSSGLAAAKAAHKQGWLRAYHHAFSLSQALGSLMKGPGILGVNWYSSFDEAADGHLVIEPGADMRGGHELEISELCVETRTVRGPNSWGAQWGREGWWSMHWNTLERLLDEQGDYLVPAL